MELAKRYHELIWWVTQGTGLPDTVLHIHAGLAIMMVARILTGRSLGTFIPFAFVVPAELANELLDYLGYGTRWSETLRDLANTLFWPFVISLAVRWRPMIGRDRRRLAEEPQVVE